MKKAGYVWERIYPYFISLVIVVVFKFYEINLINDSNIDNALDGVNTMCALIIGFLGAMLPVILGMKNESKFVKYVFEKDKKKLFLKYLRETIITGLVASLVTIVMYFRDSIDNNRIKDIIFLAWVFITISFMICTYRCLSNMLALLFSDDKTLANSSSNLPFEKRIKTEEEEKLEEKYMKKF